MNNLPITKIKNHPNLLRDNSSNAILFLSNNDSESKRTSFFKRQQEDINKIRNDVQEMKNLLREILGKIQIQEGNNE